MRNVGSRAHRDVLDRITLDICRTLLVDLVRCPSPQTALMEDEPLLKRFIASQVEPRLRQMGFSDIQYDGMGNLCSAHGAGTSGRSLMLITNAMNQPQSTMTRAYQGDVTSGKPYGLPGDVVLGKGASEQKANMTAMFIAMASVLASGIPVTGRLIHLCCLSGETGKHDAIKSVVETTGAKADMAFLGGTSLKLSLGNRGRLDVQIKVRGRAVHSSGPKNGCNAITGAMDILRRLDSLALRRRDARVGDQSLTANRIRSFPDSTHTIQDLCEIGLDRRLLPGEDPDAAFAEIEKAAMETDGALDPVSGQALRVEVIKGAFMYPSMVPADAPIVTFLDSICDEVLGAPPEHIYAPNAFDQGYLNHIGIPTVNWGPGEYAFAHTDLDMASVERVRDAARVFAMLLIRHLCEC